VTQPHNLPYCSAVTLKKKDVCQLGYVSNITTENDFKNKIFGTVFENGLKPLLTAL
jgi:hypothetical protein